MIAIVGKPGAGKTYTIKLLQKAGYSILIADDFFNKEYQYNNEGYKIIKNKLGDDYVNKTSVDRDKLREFAIKNMDQLEKLVHPLLENKIKSNTYDFVEIPILNSQHANFEKMFSKIVNIINKEEHIKNELKKRKIDKDFLKVISNRQKKLRTKNVLNVISGDIKSIITLLD